MRTKGFQLFEIFITKKLNRTANKEKCRLLRHSLGSLTLGASNLKVARHLGFRNYKRRPRQPWIL